MDKSNHNESMESNNEKLEWERHFKMVHLYEKGVEIEEIMRIVGLPEEDIDKYFPKLY